MGAALSSIGKMFAPGSAQAENMTKKLQDAKQADIEAAEAEKDKKNKEELENRRRGFLGLINTPQGGGAMTGTGMGSVLGYRGGLRGF